MREPAVWQVAATVACVACSHPAREVPPSSMRADAVVKADAATPTSAPPRAAEGAVASPSACDAAGGVLLFVSPSRPVRGRRLYVVAVARRELSASLSVTFAGATRPAIEAIAPRGGPPYFWLAELDAPMTGNAHAILAKTATCGGGEVAAKDITIGRPVAPRLDAPRTALWNTRRTWSPAMEDLYSAFILNLFDAPPDALPSWGALHEVLRDPRRNFLFDYMGSAEDEQGVVIRPDCADLPYFLRAYFAFKLGLPFGWSHCSRGENGSAPRCSDFSTNETPFPSSPTQPQPIPAWADPDRPSEGRWENSTNRFGEMLRTTLADAVQSGAGRTAADDEESDYYPVPLSVETLRPGTIFADPYGHVLVVTSRIPQSASSAGALFAVDGQPDGTVARKRFWRGNFLFAIDPSLGSAGFKRFRPVFRDKATGRLRRARNSEIGDYSPTDQYARGVDGFYDAVDDVLSPQPLDPTQALIETVQAFEEQVRTRVISVDNGRKALTGGKRIVEMPEGAKIFEAEGDWEDFSTPSRDLRLLIAVDVARAVPARVESRPSRFAMPPERSAAEVRKGLEERLALEFRERKFSYIRTDGSTWGLTLKDVADREESLEIAYDPNDCVELRWGARPGSDEASTCVDHAPAAQTERMQAYRAWFHERRRPPR